jgi:hypothetical protein
VNQAWVVAVDMGYGHQRAAYPFRDIAFERVFTANTDEIVTTEERRQWERMQGFYEGVSRAHNVPVIGPWLWRLYDSFQAIHPHYPFQDLSKPSLGSSQFQRWIRRGLGASVSTYSRRRDDLPLLTTFYAVALAADQAGRNNVFCVVTDSDINRVWVAEEPRKSRVHYLAPTPLSRKRLLQYGVADERIFVTGFPLSTGNVSTAPADLARRIAALDRKGVVRARYGPMLKSMIGTVPEAPGAPISITFPVGGAGAQSKMAGDIVKSLATHLRDGRMRLNLVAGVRRGVYDYFQTILKEQGLESEIDRSVHVLFTATKDEYFERFNELMRVTDVLWTKPSELSFYAALGIPIVMAPPLGAHEERNQEMLLRIGAGQRQEPPRAAAEWLTDGAESGLFALQAFNGFLNGQRHGTENVKRVLFAADRSRVELVAAPPEIGVPEPTVS